MLSAPPPADGRFRADRRNVRLPCVPPRRAARPLHFSACGAAPPGDAACRRPPWPPRAPSPRAPAAAAADPPLLYLTGRAGLGRPRRQSAAAPCARPPSGPTPAGPRPARSARCPAASSPGPARGASPRSCARAGTSPPSAASSRSTRSRRATGRPPPPGRWLGARPAGPGDANRVVFYAAPGAGRAGGPRRPAPAAAGQAAAAGRRHEPRPRHLPPDLPRRPLPAAAARDGHGAHALARALAGRTRRAAHPAGPRRRPGPGRAVDAGPLDAQPGRELLARGPGRLRPARRGPGARVAGPVPRLPRRADDVRDRYRLPRAPARRPLPDGSRPEPGAHRDRPARPGGGHHPAGERRASCGRSAS